MRNDSPAKIVIVATSLCIVCSIFVSSAAVFLRDTQEANKAADKKRNILAAAGYSEVADVDAIYDEHIEARLVDLETGEYTDAFPVETFDQRKAAKTPETSVEIPRSADAAGIGRRSKYAPVYLIKNGDDVDGVIIPIHGKGLWSTMYGFLALEPDLNTVKGFGFYEHGETPGLGGEVDNPRWKSTWIGKKVFDDDGNVAAEVIKGSVNASSPDAIHQVDGLSGATITARGVSGTVRYWISENGFGHYLDRKRTEGLGGEAPSAGTLPRRGIREVPHV